MGLHEMAFIKRSVGGLDFLFVVHTLCIGRSNNVVLFYSLFPITFRGIDIIHAIDIMAMLRSGPDTAWA